jgi:hypothetical protein
VTETADPAELCDKVATLESIHIQQRTQPIDRLAQATRRVWISLYLLCGNQHLFTQATQILCRFVCSIEQPRIPNTLVFQTMNMMLFS